MVYVICCDVLLVFFFKQKTAYEMRISDWSSDVCSSDLKARVLIFGDVGRALERLGRAEDHIGLIVEIIFLIHAQRRYARRLGRGEDDRPAQAPDPEVVAAIFAEQRVVEIARVVTLERDEADRQLVGDDR